MIRSLLLLCVSSFVASSFQTTSFLSRKAIQQPRRAATLFSSKEEEIARLEEQLRKLREEAEEEGLPEDLEKGVKIRVALEKVKGKDMLLSEQELLELQMMNELGQESEGLNPIVVGAAAVCFAITLFLFAQVPVGQDDYQRYGGQIGNPGSSAINKIDLGDLNTDVQRP